MDKFFTLNKKSFILSIIIIALISLGSLLIWTFNLYPIVFVNYHPIMAYTYFKSVDVAKKYYGVAINMSDEKNLKMLQQAVLQGLIDETAIDSRLKQDMTATEEQNKINAQSQQLVSDPNVLKGLFQRSISVSDAEKYFFPIAIKNEIISGQLALENKELMTWLMDARKSLKVVILLKGVYWKDDKVQFD